MAAGGTNSVVQRSFSGGLLSSHLAARADQVKYATGLRECLNFLVLKHGGVANRPGTEYVATVKDSNDITRLWDFVFNADQTYVLEFGDLYLRFHHDGAPLRVSSVRAWRGNLAITGATAANPVVITAVAHGLIDGDSVVISGVVGMVQLNGHTYTVANKTADTFELEGVDGSGYTAYASGGVVDKVYIASDLVVRSGTNYVAIADGQGHDPASSATYWYPLTGDILELPTPYLAADVFALRKVQSADVETIVHPSYQPHELRRLGATAWTFVPIDLTGPSLDRPTAIAIAGTAGSKTQTYYVTSVADNGNESLPGLADVVSGGTAGAVPIHAISASIHGSVVMTTSSAHGFLDGDRVTITGIHQTGLGSSYAAMLNGRTFFIDYLTSTTFRLRNQTGYSSILYVADSGTATKVGATSLTLADATEADPITVTWTAAAGAAQYNIYRVVNGIAGFIGTSATVSFIDDGITPDFSITPLVNRTAFGTTNNYPSAVAYCQQRLALANTNANPELIEFSRIGDYHNFARRSPLADDDSFSLTINGEQVNAVKHIREVAGRLLVFTSGGEWTVNGNQDGTITPDAPNLRRQGTNGSADLSPIIIESTAIYVQAGGAVVRDLSFDLAKDGYRGTDLTIYSSDLFQGFTLVDWAFQRQPNSVLWVVRSDGALLGLTYIQDQQIWGWHRHDSDGGIFESVTCVPEGTEDVLYAVVRRTINGSSKRYVERLHTREVSDVSVDAFFVDCGATFDGRNTGATTLTLSGGTTWLSSEDLTLTASAAQFIGGDVGNEYRLNQGDLTLRLVVTAYTSPTVVTVRAARDVVLDAEDGDFRVFRTGARTDWARAVDDLSGLGHLEGRTVAICADGHEEPQAAVTAGALHLQNPAAVIHVGLPIVADLELLDLEDPQGETLVGRKKLVVRADVLVNQSSGFFAGQDFDHLQEYETREDEDWDEPTRLRTDTFTLQLSSTWDNHGRLCIRQTAPLPLEVLAVVRTGALGGR